MLFRVMFFMPSGMCFTALTQHGFLWIVVKHTLFFTMDGFFSEKALYRNKHNINIKNQSSIFLFPPSYTQVSM